jgi:hypothetical protein
MFFRTLLLATLLSHPAQDQPRVSARLSSTNAVVGETIVFEVLVENATGDVGIGAPRLPPGLSLVGTQDFTEMHVSFPGGRTQIRRREYALQVAAPGRFRIPPVDVQIGNKSYRTSAVEVVAAAGSSQPRSVQSNDEAWLHAVMRPETVYVGQQSTLTVEAGFSEEIRTRLTRPAVFDIPSPTGFWVQEIPGGVQARLRAVAGRFVEVQTMQRAYFPLTAGRFAFAPARAIIDVREGFLFAPETREIRSASPKLTVLPLPDEGKPAGFKGAVGRYSVRGLVEPDTVAVGEAAQITIELTGIGNVKAAPQPTLPTIAGVEQFTPTEDATVTFTGAVAGGVKTFKWVVIPDRAGVIKVPAATYSFFDPDARAYRTVQTTPLALVVRPSTAAADDDGGAGTTLGALRTKPEHTSLGWARTRWFLLIQLIPLVLVLLAFVGRKLHTMRAQSSTLPADLKRVKDAPTAYPVFLRELEVVLRAALANTVAGDAVHARILALIQRIETQRFAPASAQAAEREALLKQAESLIREVLKSARPKSHASVAFLAFALLAGSQPHTFDSGLALYRSGHFAQAAQVFETVIARDSSDVAAWVNLGNAQYRSGERGRAVWAWARAGRAAPRDRAIVRNLQAAGAVEVLRTRPPLSVRPVEWYLLAALGWWVACALAVVAITKRRAALYSWLLLPLTIVVVALAVGVLTAGRNYAVALHDDTQLYGDPTTHSPVSRRVQAGAGLDVIEQRGEWLRVRTVTQAEGWVESDAVGRL